MTAGSSSSSTSQWKVAGEGVPLPDPARCCTTDTRGCPECAMSHSGTHGTETGVPRTWSLYTQPSQVQPGTQHLYTHGTGHTVPVGATWHTTLVRSPVRYSQEHNTCTQVWPATAGATTAAPWHVKARQFPRTQRSPLCHHPCQTVLAPASTAQQSGDSGDLHMSNC